MTACNINTNTPCNIKIGGEPYNIEIYDEYPSFLSILGYEKEKKTKVSLKSGTILVVDGYTFHKLQGCSGKGKFNFIQVILSDHEDNTL